MNTEPQILLLSTDDETIADISAALELNAQARVIPVDSMDEIREIAESGVCDLIVVDCEDEMHGLPALISAMTEKMIPTLLLENELNAERVLGALRLGVIDILTRPLDMEHLQGVVQATLAAQADAQRERVRQRRVRAVSSRMVRDRRELRERMDLLCKDLVSAYRRLAEKVVAIDGDQDA